MRRWILAAFALAVSPLAVSSAEAGGWGEGDRYYGPVRCLECPRYYNDDDYYYYRRRYYRPRVYVDDYYPRYYRPYPHYYYRPYGFYAGYGWGGWRGRGWGFGVGW